MALTQTLAQMRTGVREFGNWQGATALLRHSDARVNDAVNRALGSLRRKLDEAVPDQRWLADTTVTTSDAVSTYALPANFDYLISCELNANGVRSWLVGYEMHERAMLQAPSQSSGTPFTYRLQAANIEFLPTPEGVYTAQLWYVPTVQQFATSGADDAVTFDTINRLDDYVIAYAARVLATKDKAWDLVAECRNVVTELSGEIAVLGRGRDKNSPARIVDESYANRFGRRPRWG